jgi:hypothetical protein
VQGLDWHRIFWLNEPVGLIAAALSAVKLPESCGPRARLDLPGVVIAAAGSVSLAWGLVRSATIGWGSAQVIGALCLSAALSAAFALWERRASEPMLPLRLLRVRAAHHRRRRDLDGHSHGAGRGAERGRASRRRQGVGRAEHAAAVRRCLRSRRRRGGVQR